MKFFTGLWRGLTVLKNTTGNIVFLLLLLLIAVMLFSTDSIHVNNKTALVLNPEGVIVEQRSVTNPFSDLMMGYQQVPETLLRDLLLAVATAKSDDRITAMVLDLSELQGATMGNLEEIGAALVDFKSSGKPVFAFAPSYSQGQYYIAAHADKIFLDKNGFQTFGGVFLTGLGIYPTYYKSALDKLKIDIHVFSIGDYKDAVEPYLYDGMSERSREANLAWLEILWGAYRDTIAEHRSLTTDAFREYTNAYNKLLTAAGNDPAKVAVDHGFADEILTAAEWQYRMQKVTGKSGHSFRQVTLQNYLKATRPPIHVPSPAMDKIAVITASGTILDGEQPAGTIGGDSVSSLIQQARWNDRIKGVVLRINSPGGSAAASEKIRHELELIQQDGKPVVVSMSSYAASGGYWVASTANKIYALKSTVTGSIGTFMLFPTFEQSLAELGIHNDGVGTTTLSGALNPFRTISPVLRETLQGTVKNTYDRFLSLVAAGRDMSVEEVNERAQGRVWTGKTAVELGLVDAIGGLQEAVRSAAHLADVTAYEVIHLEKQLSPRERLISELLNAGMQTLARLYPGQTGASPLALLPKGLADLISMSRTPGVYLQCFHCDVH